MKRIDVLELQNALFGFKLCLPNPILLQIHELGGSVCEPLKKTIAMNIPPFSSDESPPETYNMCGHISNPGIDRELHHVYKL